MLIAFLWALPSENALETKPAATAVAAKSESEWAATAMATKSAATGKQQWRTKKEGGKIAREITS